MQSVNWSMSSSHSLPHSSARLLTSSSQPPEQELDTEKILAGSLGQEEEEEGEAALCLLRRRSGSLGQEKEAGSGSLAPWHPRAARHRRRVASVAVMAIVQLVQCVPPQQPTELSYSLCQYYQLSVN